MIIQIKKFFFHIFSIYSVFIIQNTIYYNLYLFNIMEAFFLLRRKIN